MQVVCVHLVGEERVMYAPHYGFVHTHEPWSRWWQNNRRKWQNDPSYRSSVLSCHSAFSHVAGPACSGRLSMHKDQGRRSRLASSVMPDPRCPLASTFKVHCELTCQTSPTCSLRQQTDVWGIIAGGACIIHMDVDCFFCYFLLSLAQIVFPAQTGTRNQSRNMNYE